MPQAPVECLVFFSYSKQVELESNETNWVFLHWILLLGAPCQLGFKISGWWSSPNSQKKGSHATFLDEPKSQTSSESQSPIISPFLVHRPQTSLDPNSSNLGSITSINYIWTQWQTYKNIIHGRLWPFHPRQTTKKPQRWHIDAGAFASPAPHSEFINTSKNLSFFRI